MEETRRPAQSRELHTRCGRDIRVAGFAPPGLPPGMGRVVLDTPCAPYDEREVWASLTPEEARRLAGFLLTEAAALERRSRPPGPYVAVVPLDGDAWEVTVRGHALRVDQPVTDGGRDSGPTPVELFVASVAACVAHYAGRFLDRHGLDRGALRVTAGHTMSSDRPARLTALTVQVDAPGLPPDRAEALEAVVSHCTVKNTIEDPPPITVALGRAGPAGVRGPGDAEAGGPDAPRG